MDATFTKRVEIARDIYQRVAQLDELMSQRFFCPTVVVCYKEDGTDRFNFGVALAIGRCLYIHEGRLCRLRSRCQIYFVEEIKLDEEAMRSLAELQKYLQQF